MPESFFPTSGNSTDAALKKLTEDAQELLFLGKTKEARALFFSSDFRVPHWQRSLRLGEFLLETGEFTDSIEQFSLVLDYARQAQESSLRSLACHNLAIAYRKLGYFELAAQFQQYSIACGDLRSANHLTLEEEVEQLTDHAACDLTGRANDAILQEDYQLAEQLLNISLTREILYGDACAQAADWGNIGILHGLQGRYLSAVTCLRKAQQLHRQSKDLAGMGQDLVHLAEIFWILNRPRHAIRCLTNAISCFSDSLQTAEEQSASARLKELQRMLKVQQHDPLLN